MPFVVKAIGIICVVVGVICFLMPQYIRKIIEYVKVDKKIYIAAAIRIAIGVLLFVSIPFVTWPWIAGIIGAIALISAGMVFLLGMEKTFTMLDKVSAMPDNKIRIFPLIAGILGVLLIYAA